MSEHKYAVVDDIELPPNRRRLFRVVDVFPLTAMSVGASFFVPFVDLPAEGEDTKTKYLRFQRRLQEWAKRERRLGRETRLSFRRDRVGIVEGVRCWRVK